MAAAQRAKASDKQGIVKKLVTTLKKRYKGSPPKDDRPVLETLLFSACLENVGYEDAEAAFERLMSTFHDLNEIRVSAISELTAALVPLPDAELRAWRIRSTLHFVFEKNFAFEFESLRKKTQDLAVKQLAKINELSAFNRTYTLQAALGSHVIPIDDAMAHACIWLGLADRGSHPEHVSETLKPVVRKPEAPLFCYLVRSLATDPQMKPEFDDVTVAAPAESDGDTDDYDLSTSPARLARLLEKGPSRAKAAGTNGARKKKSTGSARSKSSAGSAKKPAKAASGKTGKRKAASA